jgi:hypothetical protein
MPWDPSVQSLVAFPQALAMLGEDPRWVRNMGGASFFRLRPVRRPQVPLVCAPDG